METKLPNTKDRRLGAGLLCAQSAYMLDSGAMITHMTTSMNYTMVVIALAIIVIVSLFAYMYNWRAEDGNAAPIDSMIEWRTKELTSTAQYYVTVGNEVAYASSTATAAAAGAHCQEMAYANENYMKQVVCVYEGEEKYNDVFIPG